ncbi:hypothetical protein [Nocardiopsis coralliicola]
MHDDDPAPQQAAPLFSPRQTLYLGAAMTLCCSPLFGIIAIVFAALALNAATPAGQSTYLRRAHTTLLWGVIVSIAGTALLLFLSGGEAV